MRFLLSTCWLVGAGGGWTLALAGLSAGARGANALVDLVIVGGAASWVGMLWTALRPGKSPNSWQKVLAGAAWLMPITMIVLRHEFSLNFILLSVASAICVTFIVVVYPSQSYVPSFEVDSRLEVHLAQVAAAAAAKKSAEDGGVGTELGQRIQSAPVGPIAATGQSALESQLNPLPVGTPPEGDLIAQSSAPKPDLSGLDLSLREALLEQGVPESVLDTALRRASGTIEPVRARTARPDTAEAAALGTASATPRVQAHVAPAPVDLSPADSALTESVPADSAPVRPSPEPLDVAAPGFDEVFHDAVDDRVSVYAADQRPLDQVTAPRPEPVTVVRKRQRAKAEGSRWDRVPAQRKRSAQPASDDSHTSASDRAQP